LDAAGARERWSEDGESGSGGRGEALRVEQCVEHSAGAWPKTRRSEAASRAELDCVVGGVTGAVVMGVAR